MSKDMGYTFDCSDMPKFWLEHITNDSAFLYDVYISGLLQAGGSFRIIGLKYAVFKQGYDHSSTYTITDQG